MHIIEHFCQQSRLERGEICSGGSARLQNAVDTRRQTVTKGSLPARERKDSTFDLQRPAPVDSWVKLCSLRQVKTRRCHAPPPPRHRPLSPEVGPSHSRVIEQKPAPCSAGKCGQRCTWKQLPLVDQREKKKKKRERFCRAADKETQYFLQKV